MVYWDNFDESTDVGFRCELPAGTYYVGDPEEMLLPTFRETVRHLQGAYEDMDSGALIFIYNFNTNMFDLKNEKGQNTLIMSDSTIVAIMSEDMVDPEYKHQDHRLIFNSSTVVEVHTGLEAIEMKNSKCIMTLCHYYLEDEESDEQMYARHYAAKGIEY